MRVVMAILIHHRGSERMAQDGYREDDLRGHWRCLGSPDSGVFPTPIPVNKGFNPRQDPIYFDQFLYIVFGDHFLPAMV